MLNLLTCLITSMIFMTIATNLVLSLGMVGALSIVRFRAAVKDPLDIGFLFLAVAAGLSSGAGLYPLAAAGTSFILLIYVVLTFLSGGKKSFVLVIKHDDASKEAVAAKVKTLGGKLKSAVAYERMTELTVAVKVRGADTSIPDDIKKIEGVESAVLLEYVRD
jgi:uncharacterized membrane protein YhiD involved in acid resistance